MFRESWDKNQTNIPTDDHCVVLNYPKGIFTITLPIVPFYTLLQVLVGIATILLVARKFLLSPAYFHVCLIPKYS